MLTRLFPIVYLPLLQNMPSSALHHRVSTGVWEARWHMATGCRVRPPKSSGHRSYRGGHRAALLTVLVILALTGLYLDRPVELTSGSKNLGENQKLAHTSGTSLQVHP